LYVGASAGGDITIEGFTIINANSPGWGGGIRALTRAEYSGESTAGNITISNNIVTKNIAGSRAGIYAYSEGDGSGETSGAVTLIHNTVSGNTSASTVGGIHTESFSNDQTAGPITLTGNIVSSNTASSYSGIHAESHTSAGGKSGAISLTNNIVSNNSAVSGGMAGIYAKSNAVSGTSDDINIINNTITGNSAFGQTGGIYVQNYNGNTINFYNNIIYNNTASSVGYGDITLITTDGTSNGYNNDYDFSEMSGTWDYSGSNLNTIDPEFLDPGNGDFRLRSSSPLKEVGNSSLPFIPSNDFEGDARPIDTNVDIGADEVSIVTTCVSDATKLQAALTNGQSNGKGDVLMVQEGTYNGNFTFNSGETYGISLLGGYSSACTIRNIDPENTILDGEGSGKVLSFGSTVSDPVAIDGFTVQNGANTSHGGGIYIYFPGADISVSNNIIKNNTATGYAGGAFLQSYVVNANSGDISFTNNTVSGNSCSGNYGGGVYINTVSENFDSGGIKFSDNFVTGNDSNTKGGGAYLRSLAEFNMGAIYFTGNLIADNTSPDSGGVYIYSNSASETASIVTLTNNTVTVNSSSSGSGGGIDVLMDFNIFNFYNNIIWGNSATASGDDIFLSGTGTVYGYNNIYTDLSGTRNGGSGGNIVGSSPRLSSNYHLRPGSPCIDAGTNTAPFLPATDIDGDNRFIDSDRDDTPTVDMGADEFIPKGVLSFLMLLLN